MCCTRLAENAGRKNCKKIAIWAPSHNCIGPYLHKACIDNRKNTSLQYGELRPTNGGDRFGSLGPPCSKFQRVSRLAFVTAATSLTGGQPNFARLSIYALVAKIIAGQSCAMVPRWRFWAIFCVLCFQRAACSTFQTCILNSH